jgi:predicted nuclease of predicted toxin-antitoxin system
MKILLDAHISGRTVGKVLAEGGHDVRALDSEPELEALSDPEVLELAAEEGRILVTANIRDFEPLLREWAGEGRPHAGVNLVPSSVRNEAFGVLISSVEETLAGTAQEEWRGSATHSNARHTPWSYATRVEQSRSYFEVGGVPRQLARGLRTSHRKAEDLRALRVHSPGTHQTLPRASQARSPHPKPRSPSLPPEARQRPRPRTVNYIHVTLHKALMDAVSDALIPRNAASVRPRDPKNPKYTRYPRTRRASS